MKQILNMVAFDAKYFCIINYSIHNKGTSCTCNLYTLPSVKFFMEYTVIKKTDVNELITEVNLYLNKGWKPTGGASIAFGRVRNTTGGNKDWTEVLFHAQALVKE